MKTVPLMIVAIVKKCGEPERFVNVDVDMYGDDEVQRVCESSKGSQKVKLLFMYRTYHT